VYQLNVYIVLDVNQLRLIDPTSWHGEIQSIVRNLKNV